MELTQLCAPAIIYLIFSVTQIIIDTLKGLYNTALIKVIVTITITYLLNVLCQQGLGIVSWILVFIPFIFMTVVVTLILYIFGLDAASGQAQKAKQTSKCGDGISIDAMGNVVIYDPEYNASKNGVYYASPNIIVPNPHANDPLISSQPLGSAVPPTGQSGYAYQS